MQADSVSFHLFVLSLISLTSILQFSKYKSFTSFSLFLVILFFWCDNKWDYFIFSLSNSLLLVYRNVWITINCGKFWKRWEYQTTWPASWETYMQVRKQQLERDMEQQTGSK